MAVRSHVFRLIGALSDSLSALIRTPEASPVGPAIQRLRLSVGLFLLIIVLGVVGYSVITDFTPFEALYQTILTVTTIGFQEVRPLDDAGRSFTIVLAVLGVGSVIYLLTTVATLVVEGEIKRDVEAWRMGKRIDSLTGHYIVCGAGRVGAEVARAMQDRSEPFVMIDIAADALAALEEDWLVLEGDASNNELLEMAGVRRARGVVVASRSDAENTFITLTVKAINPSLYVVARANDPESEPKLRQAGADRVIAPTVIAGRRMAVSVIHPAVADFTETVLHGAETGEALAQVDVQFGSALDGSDVGTAFGGREHVEVLGVRHRDGRLDVAPTRGVALHAGDAMMVLGTSEAIEALSAAVAADAV
ncbi:MAG TPA: potassium channel family protein [Dehalococcoidia bacterium]|nr:potassium channel family protein [Dehalococcoidia bacterium]